MSNIITTPLTAKEAIELTGRIKTAANQLWQLLLEAHERKAWKALGYASWSEYVSTEFDMGRSHSYRLLDQGRVIRAIEDAAGESVPHGGQISERVARDIKPVLDEVTEEIRTRVEQGADPVETTYEVIEARRATPPTESISADEAPEPPAETEAEYEDHEPDLLAELEDAAKRIAQQDQLIKSLTSSDLAHEVADWQERFHQLQGRLNQEITTRQEAEKQATYYGKILRRLANRFGVERYSEIERRVASLMEGAA